MILVKSALEELQKALFACLSGDTTLMNEITDVYDKVPLEAEFDFVTIGDFTVNDYSTKLQPGENITVTLHAWHDGPSKLGAHKLLDLMIQALTRSTLEVTGFEVDDIRCELKEVFADEEVYHGIIRMRLLIGQGGL